MIYNVITFFWLCLGALPLARLEHKSDENADENTVIVLHKDLVQLSKNVKNHYNDLRNIFSDVKKNSLFSQKNVVKY